MDVVHRGHKAHRQINNLIVVAALAAVKYTLSSGLVVRKLLN